MKAEVLRRIRLHCRMASELSQIKDKELVWILRQNSVRSGWGTNHVFKIKGTKIFAKKIPLTRLEYENAFDTSNLYRLPLYYNYGVGSAGFGAYRELVAQIKTTNWILEGRIEHIPLMYHYRIIPRSQEPTEIDEAKHQKYVERWNSSSAIDHYIRERRHAEFEIVLCLEYFPYTLGPWFESRTEKIQSVSETVRETLDFLSSNGLIHFDAHLHNIVTDGERPYLTDFGLALDKNYSLNSKEQEFYKGHTQYDFGEFTGSLGLVLESKYRKLTKSKKKQLHEHFEIDEKMTWEKRQEKLLSDLRRLKRLAIFDVSAKYCKFLEENRDTILIMNAFFLELSSNQKKNTKFDTAGLKRALKR